MNLTSRKTAQMPVIMNFTSPKKAEVIEEEDYKVIYDVENSISYICGGGGGRSSTGSTSQKGYRDTRVVEQRKSDGSPSVVSSHNDAPVMTDD